MYYSYPKLQYVAGHEGEGVTVAIGVSNTFKRGEAGNKTTDADANIAHRSRRSARKPSRQQQRSCRL